MVLNIFDIGIILLCFMFFIVGFKNGVIKEVFSLVGTVVVFAISFIFKGMIGNIMCLAFPFFEFSGSLEGITSFNILLYQVIAFMAIFCILLSVYALLMGISGIIQKVVNLTVILIPVSKILGGIVAIIKGYVIMFAVFLLLMIPLKNHEIYNESKLVNFMIYKTPVLSDSTSKVTKSVEDVFALTKKVSKKELSSEEANLKTIDIMLKYKICDKDIIRELIRRNKLENVKNIDSILSKY